jgi:hypothetical protein
VRDAEYRAAQWLETRVRPCALRHNPFVLVNYSSTICLNPPADHGRFKSWPVSTGRKKRCDGGPAKFQGAAQVSPSLSRQGATRRTAVGLLLGAPCRACSGIQQTLSQYTTPGPAQEPIVAGTGQVKVGLILPLSAPGNTGVAAQSMKNAAEMALAESQVQYPASDQGRRRQSARCAAGNPAGARRSAEIILGPLFAASVPATAQLARTRRIGHCILDRSQRGRPWGLSPELPSRSDVNRIIEYSPASEAIFRCAVAENAYGNVVEAAFADGGPQEGRIVAFEKYGADRASAARNVAQALRPGRCAFYRRRRRLGGERGRRADGSRRQFEKHPAARHRPVGQSARIRESRFAGRPHAAPDPAGFRNFSARYRAKFGSDPVRTATLAYDSVALVAALARTQGSQRFSPEVLTNPSGFAGVDGLFRFRADGTNERGLAVMKVATGGGVAVAGSPKSFGA